MFKKSITILFICVALIAISGCSSKTLPKKCGDKKWEGYDWYEKQ